MYVYSYVPMTTTELVGYVNPSSFVIGCAIFCLPLTQVLTNNQISHHSPVVQPMQRHVLVEVDLIDGYAQVNFPYYLTPLSIMYPLFEMMPLKFHLSITIYQIFFN